MVCVLGASLASWPRAFLVNCLMSMSLDSDGPNSSLCLALALLVASQVMLSQLEHRAGGPGILTLTSQLQHSIEVPTGSAVMDVQLSPKGHGFGPCLSLMPSSKMLNEARPLCFAAHMNGASSFESEGYFLINLFLSISPDNTYVHKNINAL